MNTTMNDRTAEFDPADISSNKGMGILAYIGFLFLIPLFAAPKSNFARFHTNQGLVLFLCEIVFNVALRILSVIIPFLGILNILSLAFLVVMILGIVNAANGKAIEFPIIGSIKILK